MLTIKNQNKKRFTRLFLSAFASLFLGITLAYGATYTVTKTADTNDGTCDSDCSLREAVAAANSTTASDIINFNIPTTDPNCSLGVCVITLTLGDLTINSISVSGSLTITNAGGSQGIEISGNGNSRVFFNNGSLTLNSLTIRDGFANGGNGGGIFNAVGASMGIINSTIRNNSCTYDGGGILNSGQMRITNSTISNNTSTSGNGAGITNGGSLSLSHVTISNNTAANVGGGVFAPFGGVNASNTIIANNSASNGPDFFGSINSSGYNLIRNTTGMSGNFPQTGDISGIDPLLAPLGYYGGLSWTRALLDPSSAINNGNSSATSDQRGASRPFGSAVDIGAYERNPDYIALLPNGQANTPYGSFTITPNNEGCTMNMTGLPPNLSLTQLGSSYVITGTPIQTGTFNPVLTINCGGNTTTITYQIFIAAPSAASVTVSGRVFAGSGKGLRNAYVVLTDDQGVSRAVQTSSFGYYRFDEVEAGRTYILTVQSKRYTYEQRVIFVTEDITNLDFHPLNE
ncbi:MAG: CSLREA domain-containing protein [Acidobacteria bacterium]|jgi:CSLREA domain-containing protein|nr:MAG: CSLREA domain-containing protein [Acidobacteriota bacterium]GIU82263.1 MAG: hypothetical protein KatS3mg006_1327 [Pyrinomonadaceae bacterium]